ncbi:MAG: ATP-binding protein [Candidatus Omnitrophica bacterium]|nr:ATP-binding protein [Candidatus Omnitrophota bacterium]
MDSQVWPRSRFSFLIRIISIVLVISFIAYDIAWAYPNTFLSISSQQNNKLAVPSLFQEEESGERLVAKYVETLLEKGLASYNIDLNSVKDRLTNLENKYRTWFRNHLICAISDGQILIKITPQYIIRYYDPGLSQDQKKYIDKNDTVASVQVNGGLCKELLMAKSSPLSDAEGGCIGKFETFEIIEIKDLKNNRVKIIAVARRIGSQVDEKIELYGKRAPPQTSLVDFEKTGITQIDNALEKAAKRIEPGQIIILNDNKEDLDGLAMMYDNLPLVAMHGSIFDDPIARTHELGHLANKLGLLATDVVLDASGNKRLFNERLARYGYMPHTSPEALKFHYAMRQLQRDRFGARDKILSLKTLKHEIYYVRGGNTIDDVNNEMDKFRRSLIDLRESTKKVENLLKDETDPDSDLWCYAAAKLALIVKNVEKGIGLANNTCGYNGVIPLKKEDMEQNADWLTAEIIYYKDLFSGASVPAVFLNTFLKIGIDTPLDKAVRFFQGQSQDDTKEFIRASLSIVEKCSDIEATAKNIAPIAQDIYKNRERIRKGLKELIEWYQQDFTVSILAIRQAKDFKGIMDITTELYKAYKDLCDKSVYNLRYLRYLKIASGEYMPHVGLLTHQIFSEDPRHILGSREVYGGIDPRNVTQWIEFLFREAHLNVIGELINMSEAEQIEFLRAQSEALPLYRELTDRQKIEARLVYSTARAEKEMIRPQILKMLELKIAVDLECCNMLGLSDDLYFVEIAKHLLDIGINAAVMSDDNYSKRWIETDAGFIVDLSPVEAEAFGSSFKVLDRKSLAEGDFKGHVEHNLTFAAHGKSSEISQDDAGDPEARMRNILRRIESAEAVNRNDKTNACFTPRDDAWISTEEEILKDMRHMLELQGQGALDPVKGMLDNLAYVTARRTYNHFARESIRKTNLNTLLFGQQTRRTLYLKEGSKIGNGWKCDLGLSPDSPQMPFTMTEKTIFTDIAEELPYEVIGKEVATIACGVEGKGLVVTDFLVSGRYRGKAIASWLFAQIYRDLKKKGLPIDKIRFDYQCIGAREFILNIAQPSRERLVIGPFCDIKGEYYLPGEFLKGCSEIDEKIRPAVLMEIAKNLVMALDPAISNEEASSQIKSAIIRVSDAVGYSDKDKMRKVNIYSPATGTAGGEALWQCVYMRETRESRLKEPSKLKGEKRLLEMMTRAGKGRIEPINLNNEKGEAISHYGEGVWVIHDRNELHKILKTGRAYEALKPIIEEDDVLLKEDLKKYGKKEGNAITYAYALDHDGIPLFLFALIGTLNPNQIAAVRSVLLESQIAAERARLMHSPAISSEDISGMDETLKKLEVIGMRLLRCMHPVGGPLRCSIFFWRKTKAREAEEALDISNDIMDIFAEADKRTGDMKVWNDIAELNAIRTLLRSEEDEMGSQISSERRSTHSLLNVYYPMLAVSSTNDVKGIVKSAIRAEGVSFEEVREPFEVTMKYAPIYSRFRTYHSVGRHYRRIEENLKMIPSKLIEIKELMMKWRVSDGGRMAYDLFNSLPQGIRENDEAFIEWVTKSPENPKTGKPLNTEETASVKAAYYVGGFIAKLDDLIPFVERKTTLRVIREEVDLIGLVKEAINFGITQAAYVGRKPARVNYEHPGEKCQVLTDPEDVKVTIVGELVCNAVKYAKDNDAEVDISLEVNKTGGYARISVGDRGVGITHAERDKELFKGKGRLEKTREKVEGSGMGLYLGKMDARDLGGHLLLEDSTPDKGSIFSFYLPLIGEDTVWFKTKEERETAQRMVKDLHDTVKELSEKIADGNERLKSDIYGAHRILGWLYEDSLWLDKVDKINVQNMSRAYYRDTLSRRLRPLLDTDYIRAAMGENLPECEGLLSRIDALFEEAGIGKNTPGGSDAENSIRECHRLQTEGSTAAPVSDRRKIALSEGLFAVSDLPAIRSVIDKSFIEILPEEKVRELSGNTKSSKDTLVCVVSSKEFNEDWKESHRNNNKSLLLVVDGDLKGANYLYTEAVIGLARAMMDNDVARIQAYSGIIFGKNLDDSVLECLKKDNPIIELLKFRPITANDIDILRLMMEGFLQSA